MDKQRNGCGGKWLGGCLLVLCLAATGCQDKSLTSAQAAETQATPEKAPAVAVTQSDVERAFDEQKADIAQKNSRGIEALSRVKSEKPLIGDLNGDGRDDAIVAYEVADEGHVYHLYAVFLNDGQKLRYHSNFNRGDPGVSLWEGGEEKYPSYITFLSIKDGVVQAEERSRDKQKRVLQENYHFDQNKLLSAPEMAYQKSDRSGFFDLNGDALPLDAVLKRFGKPVKISNEPVGCASFFDEQGMQDYQFTNAVFEVWKGKAGFAGMTDIPKDVRFVLRGLIVTADMTEQAFREKTSKNPHFSVFSRPAEGPEQSGTMYFVEPSTEGQRWIFTFHRGRLSGVSFMLNRC